MKRLTQLTLLTLLLVQFISAEPTLIFQHENIQPGETILATITTSGEFSEEISNSNIKFFDGRREISFEFDILYYEGTHYFYAYTQNEGEFKLQISDILHEEDGILKSKTIEKQFNVTKDFLFDEETNESYTEILSVKPGLIFTSVSPKLRFTNKGTRTFNISFNDSQLSLTPQQTEEMIFNSDTNFSFKTIQTYKEFQIPVIYLNQIDSNSTVIVPDPPSSDEIKIRPYPLQINLTVGEEKTRQITIFSFSDENITLSKITSDIPFLQIEQINFLEAKTSKKLNLTFTPSATGHESGSLNIFFNKSNESKNTILSMSIFILPLGINETNVTLEVVRETCEEIGGDICGISETCDSEAKFTSEGEYCCLSSCVQSQSNNEGSESSKGLWIGIVILLALGGAGFYFYKRQKRVSPQKPKDKIIETSEKYNNRLKGSLQRT